MRDTLLPILSEADSVHLISIMKEIVIAFRRFEKTLAAPSLSPSPSSISRVASSPGVGEGVVCVDVPDVYALTQILIQFTAALSHRITQISSVIFHDQKGSVCDWDVCSF
jgi:hypothetical protein